MIRLKVSMKEEPMKPKMEVLNSLVNRMMEIQKQLLADYQKKSHFIDQILVAVDIPSIQEDLKELCRRT